MMRVALLVLLVGCKQIFGLQDPSVAGTVTGRYALLWIENGPGAVVESHERAYAQNEISFAARLDDGTSVDVAVADDGTFSFPINSVGQAYALVIRTPFSDYTLHHTAATLDLVDRVAGHPDRMPATPGAMLLIDVTGRPTTALLSGEYIATSGLWMVAKVTANNPIALPWTSLNSQWGAPGLLEAAKHDAVHYLGYAATATSDQLAYYGRRDDVDANSSLTVPAAMLAIDRCQRVALHVEAELARLQSYAGAAFTNPQLAALIGATPRQDFAHGVETYLASVKSPTDRTFDLQFANPLAASTTVAMSDVSLFRALPSGAELFAISRALQQIAGTDNCAAQIDLPSDQVAIATNIVVNDTALVSDNTMVPLSARDVTVMWDASPGVVDKYSIALYEVAPNTGLVLRFGAGTPAPPITIDRSALRPGVTYTIAIQAIRGVLGYGGGDDRTLQLPIYVSSIASPTFMVR